MTNEQQWQYQGNNIDEIDDKYVGFVYVITNLIDDRKYIGKKRTLFKKTSIKTVTLKTGEKRKKKIKSLVPSDWKMYYGSSAELIDDVKRLGSVNFSREIIKWCSSLSELSYYEIKYQLENDVLFHPDKFYNAYVGCRINRTHMIGKNNSLGMKPKPSSSNVFPSTSPQE